MSTLGSYTKQNYTANKACTITSANPGNGILNRWTTQPTPPIPGVTPGSDNNNMQAAFGRLDSFGLPVTDTNAAPNYSGNVSGLQCPNTAGFQVSYVDGWIVVPVGVTTVSFGFRGFGNTSAGIYVGKAPRYAKRILWNNVLIVPGGTVDMTSFPELCGMKVAFIRSMCVNGYFNGGHYVTWNVGAGFVDIPTANTHGSQPYLSKYPS